MNESERKKLYSFISVSWRSAAAIPYMKQQWNMNTNGPNENKNSHLMIAFTDIKSIKDTNKNIFMRFFVSPAALAFSLPHLRLENLWTAIDLLFSLSLYFFFNSRYVSLQYILFSVTIHKHFYNLYFYALLSLLLSTFKRNIISSNKKFIDNMKNVFFSFSFH